MMISMGDTPGTIRIGPPPASHRLITASRAGETNRGRVLEALHRLGPASRAELARRLGVNRATVASILQPLIDSGLLVEQDPVAPSSAGGKPARPLWFRDDGPHIGAVQLSPDFAAAALIGIDGTISSRRTVPYPRGADSTAVIAALDTAADACFTGDLLGIGVAASGMVNTTSGRIISMHLGPGLTGLQVGPYLAQRYHTTALVDHHPRVQALGDRWFGLGRHRQDFASVYTGEALGFGILYRGRIVRGRDGAGGEAGHTTVDIDGETCRCGRRGCWETVATLGWLRAQAGRRGIDGASDITSRALAGLAESGDADAAELADLYARNIAVGMVNNEQILALGCYILHGDICSGGSLMRDALQGWVDRLAPERGQRVEVLFAGQPDDITLLGGAGLVLSTAFLTAA